MADDCPACKQMRGFADVFGAMHHVVLPVIHVETCSQAVRNAEIARTAGGNGVFLINHGISHRELLDIARTVATEIISAGLRQGGGINRLRRQFLLSVGASEAEIDHHVSTVFSREHLRSDLILVAELPIKNHLLRHWPELAG